MVLKMNKTLKKSLFILISALLISTSIFADKDHNNCNYTKDFVKHTNIKDLNILSQSWKNTIDPDSDEYVTTHKIRYKNGNKAIIEHKFCEMYNYELNYFIADNKFKTTPKNIGKLVNKIYQQSTAVKIHFKIPLNIAITDKLTHSGFSQSKLFDFELSVPDSGNQNIEQAISYTVIKKPSSKYKSKINYYLGVGGE